MYKSTPGEVILEWQCMTIPVLVVDTNDGSVTFSPIKIRDANPTLIHDTAIREFYESFDAQIISRGKYLLYSLSMHYLQNWNSWKIRFKKYGGIEYLRYIKFLTVKKNLLGFFLYVLSFKVLRKSYNPVDFITKGL